MSSLQELALRAEAGAAECACPGVADYVLSKLWLHVLLGWESAVLRMLVLPPPDDGDKSDD
jgi:hypothetical protein